MTVLYITQNGITDHISRSQVAPYVLGLAQKGFRIHVLSAEKDGQEALVSRYRDLFEAEGVQWTRIRYRNRPRLLGQAWSQFQMERAARAIVRRDGIELVHCRSHPAALIGYRLKRRFGTRLLFDFRDFYANGGLLKARGLARLVFRRIQQLEGPMLRSADRIVCLTHKAREVLTGWYLSDVSHPKARFQVIPCCADFAHFDPARVTPADLAAVQSRTGLSKADGVLLYLGSLGPDYLLPEMLALFQQMLALLPQSRFLFVSNNGKELVDAECARQGIDPARIEFVTADRDEVPAFIGLAALSVIFIRADITKAGCSPTKLAELFAMNVPVIANSGVGDLDTILDPARNGSIVVGDFSEATLRQAIETVLLERQGLEDIRENSREFDVSVGVSRYAEVYSELLGTH